MDLVSKVMSLLFNMLSRSVTAFLPRNKHLLILWLQSPSAVILEPKKIKSDTVSTVAPSICHDVMGPDAMIFVFWMLRGVCVCNCCFKTKIILIFIEHYYFQILYSVSCVHCKIRWSQQPNLVATDTSPIERWGSWGSERGSSLPRVADLTWQSCDLSRSSLTEKPVPSLVPLIAEVIYIQLVKNEKKMKGKSPTR